MSFSSALGKHSLYQQAMPCLFARKHDVATVSGVVGTTEQAQIRSALQRQAVRHIIFEPQQESTGAPSHFVRKTLETMHDWAHVLPTASQRCTISGGVTILLDADNPTPVVRVASSAPLDAALLVAMGMSGGPWETMRFATQSCRPWDLCATARHLAESIAHHHSALDHWQTLARETLSAFAQYSAMLVPWDDSPLAQEDHALHQGTISHLHDVLGQHCQVLGAAPRGSEPWIDTAILVALGAYSVYPAYARAGDTLKIHIDAEPLPLFFDRNQFRFAGFFPKRSVTLMQCIQLVCSMLQTLRAHEGESLQTSINITPGPHGFQRATFSTNHPSEDWAHERMMRGPLWQKIRTQLHGGSLPPLQDGDDETFYLDFYPGARG